MDIIRSAMWGIILVSFVIAIAVHPIMPEMMASHWGSDGNVNGYMPRYFGLLLMPAISLFMLSLFFLIPKVDPLRENIAKFRKHYDGFVLFLLLFLFYVYILMIAWNLGTRFNMTQMMLPSMGLFFFYLGILMENAKRNWFIGIRTPWTLSSDLVWDKTHKAGAKLYKACGLLAFLGIFFGSYAIYLFIIPVIAGSVWLVVYSYLVFAEEKRLKK